MHFGVELDEFLEGYGLRTTKCSIEFWVESE